MRWQFLTEANQLEDIIKSSYNQSIIIFKHSIRCGVSTKIRRHLESSWPENLSETQAYFLDLISFRDISDKIAEDFRVEHQSPQILVIRNGQCRYSASHSDIRIENLV
jgi:bacillithiol system protein YtxJ